MNDYCSFRYQRGSRSLAANIKGSKKQIVEMQVLQQEDDEEYDIPEEVENVIGTQDTVLSVPR